MGRMNLLDWLLLNMISHNAQTECSAVTLGDILGQIDASDELREQVIKEQGLREAEWEETTDLPRDQAGRAKWDVCQDRTLSIYRNWNKDFLGHPDEQDKMVEILHDYGNGADIAACDYPADTVAWLATPKPYTRAAFIKIRDGLIIPQSPPRRKRTRPDGLVLPGEKREPGKRIPVAEQQRVYREIVAEHPEWSAREINAESHRVFRHELGEDYQMPRQRTTENIMRNDPLMVETRARGYFVWNRARCGVPAERAVIDAETPERLCVICGADVSRKSAAARTCSPACRKARQRKTRADEADGHIKEELSRMLMSQKLAHSIKEDDSAQVSVTCEGVNAGHWLAGNESPASPLLLDRW
jgi:hypothetical protein